MQYQPRTMYGPSYLTTVGTSPFYAYSSAPINDIIQNIHVCNVTNAQKTFSIYVDTAVPGGGAGTELVKDLPIGAYSFWDWFGELKTLPGFGSQLYGSASNNSALVITICGICAIFGSVDY